jgi:hypothetical protein
MPAFGRILPGLLLLLSGCGGQELSPEDRVRELLVGGESAAEQRSIGFFADHVAEDYQGRDGNGKRELLRLLRGYFLAHQSIHLLVKTQSVNSDGQRIHALLYAGMAGSPVQGFEQLLAMRAGLYRFELEFTRDDEPKLLSAQWRRADIDEVLPQLQ